MSSSSTVLSRPAWRLRAQLHETDSARIETLTRRSGAFNDAEIAIARALVEETLVRGEDAAGYHFLIADGEDAAEGFVCYGPIPATAGRYELYWIAVAPQARRSGLGRYLLSAAEEDARARGATHLFAETSIRADGGAALAFYRACGYTLEASVPDYHADGDGLGIFGKRL